MTNYPMTTTPYAEHTARLARELTAALTTLDDDAELAGRVRVLAAELARTSAAPQDVVVDDPYPQSVYVSTGINPIASARNPIAPPMPIRYEGDIAVGEASLPLQYQGPPNRVHGGILAACFDQVAGAAAHVGGRRPSYTRELTITYDAATPLNTPLVFRGWIDREEGRKRFMAAEVTVDGQITARAHGLWIAPRDPADFGK
ncbi:PaaI family thioesterase [Brevibacterium sp. 50QC2O2]|uniref:PaaI family thioesterase n=1 Tax=Brevibacterium sp. 50QC2O2 TaxID=2968459 RepID=UPI00211CEF67|nr:PaaI family thioesterase [Brevibacterium sp. 50QC2O2]MCQ9388243.1 PaaI family thioesterase [Brevibacterium sp. 50QC2O2]